MIQLREPVLGSALCTWYEAIVAPTLKALIEGDRFPFLKDEFEELHAMIRTKYGNQLGYLILCTFNHRDQFGFCFVKGYPVMMISAEEMQAKFEKIKATSSQNHRQLFEVDVIVGYMAVITRLATAALLGKPQELNYWEDCLLTSEPKVVVRLREKVIDPLVAQLGLGAYKERLYTWVDLLNTPQLVWGVV